MRALPAPADSMAQWGAGGRWCAWDVYTGSAAMCAQGATRVVRTGLSMRPPFSSAHGPGLAIT